jgi:hypothetical protein
VYAGKGRAQLPNTPHPVCCVSRPERRTRTGETEQMKSKGRRFDLGSNVCLDHTQTHTQTVKAHGKGRSGAETHRGVGIRTHNR